jgi:hypothetical protein
LVFTPGEGPASGEASVVVALHPLVAFVLDGHAAVGIGALAVLRADDLTRLLQHEAGEGLAGIARAAGQAVPAVVADLRGVVGQRLARVSIAVAVSISRVPISIAISGLAIAVAVSGVAVSISISAVTVSIAIAIAITITITVAITITGVSVAVSGVSVAIAGIAIAITGARLGLGAALGGRPIVAAASKGQDEHQR